ncbi:MULTISPECIES: Crp/Fnr family transcriptional regulator [Sphingobacterium]|uniref:Crp/Fnr family transcriptional regulator n=1 Tax=Sphingobacterium populi TaxID=1812824 RepID=A0ABW5UCR9_9SPHI|nr:Crp/Fnr family transcriptional regulator [Sphingobacterium sp. CFCC 11742]
MYQSIVDNVSKWITLSDEEKLVFTNLLECKTVAGKTMMLRAGEVCQFEGYIKKGCVRIYYMNEKGVEVILSFAAEDWWVSDIASFHEQKPSNFYIETMEETEMYILTPKTKEELLSKMPKFERVFRMLVQRNLSTVQNRLINTISKTATERYLEFIKIYPSVPLRVPQYYIASYLGISPEFVSTIRKRLSKNQI